MGANLDQLRPFLGKAAGKDLQLYRLFDVNLAPGLTATFEVPFIPDKWAIAMAAVNGLSVVVQQRSQIDSGGILLRLYSGGKGEIPGVDVYLSVQNTGTVPALGTVFALAGTDADVSPGVPSAAGSGKGSKSVPTVIVVGIAATQLLAANPNRKSAVIENNGTATIYLGRDNTVTTANGLPLSSGATLTDQTSTDAWFAISGTAGQNVPVLEIA